MSSVFSGTELALTAAEGSLLGLAKFEAKSLFGRTFLRRRPPSLVEPLRLLNLACGSRMVDGWVNADFFRLRWWKSPKNFWMLDLRWPMACASDYWDGVFFEHALEHLRPEEAESLLRELLRVLRPGAWIRIIVPDLKCYARYYAGDNQEAAHFASWPTRGAAVRSLAQGWGHRSLWDAELLLAALSEVGFVQGREVAFREGSDKRLLVDASERAWESLYIEARKPPIEAGR